MNTGPVTLGLGCGWRPQLARALEQRADLGFVEITAENIDPRQIPPALLALKRRGVRIVVHGIDLNLGGADLPSPARLDLLCRLAEALDAPLISEHVAFVRADDLEAGHLTPVPRTRDTLDILAENVHAARRALPVPLALENISALVEWPHAELSEGAFLSELLDATDTQLLLDTANVHANAHNLGLNVDDFLETLPLRRLAYCHVGGGVERDGIWHDTHAHAVAPEALAILASVAKRTSIPGAMLERDDAFPPDEDLHRELDRIAEVLAGTK